LTLSEELQQMLGERFRQFRADARAFKRFMRAYRDPRPGIDRQKLLEYYLSLTLLDLGPDDVYMDVAAQDCPFAFFVHETIGCRVFRQDLYYLKPGIHETDIGGDAGEIPLRDESVSKMSLHNSFEHFESDADTRFILEAQRLLRPGGKILIVPLYISSHYHEERDAGWIDEKGKKHLWGKGAQFARTYDPTSLKTRVLDPARSLTPTLYELLNASELGPDCHLRFFLMLEKVTPASTKSG